MWEERERSHGPLDETEIGRQGDCGGSEQDRMGLGRTEKQAFELVRYSVARWMTQALKLIKGAIKPHCHNILSIQLNLS